ncbi:uncharacterized protein JN550_009264 [Neoarthrinium moseri]|uniref:uncharacterized protein n=1 Tax=Neoarthrinium moseri TaxID=1658444 RepID=UPI001FDBF05E|nr:uncharacterized protein JN550_009264 [Neoarthrinium moseri]KAI1863985.1 hypothetical protein JN550_009264 [Neoarthrinium moseri]
MPATGFSGFGGTFEPDSGMPSATYGGEFMIDADDNLFGLGTADSDALQALDPSACGDTKALLTTTGGSGHSAKPGVPGFSPASHRDSSSSASTSSRGADSTSPKTGSQTSTDMMMTDDAALGDWKPLDGLPDGLLHGDEGNFSMMDESMDSSIAADHHNHFDNNYFDFESASSSPSPPTADGQNSLSPESHISTAQVPIKSPSAKRTKTHVKAQSQQSVTQSMQTLRTNGSREVSPMYASHESSPAAMFHAQSPDTKFDFMNPTPTNGFGGNQAWPQGFPQHPNGSFQGYPSASCHGLPQYHQPPVFPNQAPKLVIQSTPLKSRVETQIPIKMTVYNMPPMYKRLHLPMHTISKAKLLAKQNAERSPDLLELYTMLVCSSAMQDDEKRKKAFARAAAIGHPTSPDVGPLEDDDKPQNGGEVRICSGCITRERKRAGRKKNKKPEEDELWDRFQNHRAIVFNTNEVKEWQAVADPAGVGIRFPPGTMQVDAPMRIACYCRHHGEKVGFRVIFTIKDFKDRVVAQEISSSIMITDDHKAHVPANPPMQSSASSSTENAVATQATESSHDGRPLEAPLPFRQTHSTSDLQSLQQHPSALPTYQPAMPKPTNSQGTSVTATPRNQSRQASPASPSGPVSKKRKASGSAKVPTELAMTRLETSQPPLIPPPTSNQGDSGSISGAPSPFSPQLHNFPPVANSSLFAQGPQPGLNSLQQPFTTGPPTPNSNSNDQILFSGANRNMSMDNMALSQPMFSAPASAHPSRAPSPSQLRNEVNAIQQNQMTQALYTQPMNMNTPRPANPMIHKIIPGEGPKSGGIEVTILGSGFINGGLEVMFGDQRATTTTYWGETSLVCLLPPSPVTGPVIVTIKQPQVPDQPAFGKNPPIFRYVDDNEEQLMRTALAVLGQKIGGNISDVADIARSIINTRAGGQGGWGSSGAGPGAQAPGGYNFEHAHSLESGLLRVLEMIDLDDSVNKARINLRRSTGQTMLHLACSLGMIRFVAGLLSRGANPGARDKGGFTPLHFAAMHNHPEIVRRLMIAGADPTMRSLSGLAPADVSRSRDVLRVLRQVARHSRSRSGGSVHSRVSSATSLRSLWDPPSAAAQQQEFLSDSSDQAEPTDSSYEDSSEDDAEDGNEDWLDMRRPSLPRSPHNLSDISSPPAANIPAGMASPSAAMTAFRDQFSAQIQQLQQSMAMHLQNWPQFQMPQMPQMPHMPMLPDYHNYLNNAPAMQRIASLLPNIGGSRPGSAGDQTPREGDKQWWEMPSFFSGGKEVPPPAYEDIFPQQDLDTKQATAAAAAAEYEADAKCSALYDQDQATAESSKTHEVPALLQIGRKNAITKEQQENLQRAHAQRLKTGSSDKMLWFVWVPMLVLILGFMLFNGAPSFVSGTASFVKSVTSFALAPREAMQLLRDQAAGLPIAGEA